jgi:hypothetical protein
VLVTASLNGVPALGSGQSLTRTTDRFRVLIAEPVVGKVTLRVSTQNSSGRDVAAGEGAVAVPGPGSYSLTIDLEPQVGCTLEVELVGPGTGRVTSSSPGLDCGTECRKTFRRNEVVGLLSETPDLFGGWFSNGTGSGCEGRLSCAVTIGSGVTRVRANFIHRSACSASGWCVEEDLPPGPDNLYGLWGSGRDDVWAVGDFGTILHGDGILWKSVPPATDRALRGVWGTGPQNIWAVGEAGTILHYDGTAWISLPARTDAWLNAVWGSGASDIWTVGDAGTTLHWDGTAWSRVDSGTTQSLRSVWGSGPLEVWAVGDAGTVLRWGGATWASYGDGITTESLYGVWGASPRNIWMVGDSGVILQWTGSRPLIASRIGGVGGLHAVWGLHDRQVWAVGDGGVILSRTDASWSLVESRPRSTNLNVIWGSGLLDIWAAGSGRVIERYRP